MKRLFLYLISTLKSYHVRLRANNTWLKDMNTLEGGQPHLEVGAKVY